MPTFVAEYETTWDSSAPLSVSVTVAAGDLLVIYGGIHNGGGTLALPTGGGLTYTQHEISNPGSSYCTAQIWSAPCPSAQTFTLDLVKSETSSSLLGCNVLRFSGASGIGDTANGSASSGAPSLTLATSAGSSIVVFSADWDGSSGTRTFRTGDAGTFTEQSYYRAGAWMISGGYYTDAGGAGSKVVGMTAPTGQKYAAVAVEVLAETGTTYDVTGAIDATSTTSAGITAQRTGIGTVAGTSATSAAASALLATSCAVGAAAGTSASATVVPAPRDIAVSVAATYTDWSAQPTSTDWAASITSANPATAGAITSDWSTGPTSGSEWAAQATERAPIVAGPIAASDWTAGPVYIEE